MLLPLSAFWKMSTKHKIFLVCELKCLLLMVSDVPCKIACQELPYILSVLQNALTSHFIIAWYDDCCQNRLHGNIRALDWHNVLAWQRTKQLRTPREAPRLWALGIEGCVTCELKGFNPSYALTSEENEGCLGVSWERWGDQKGKCLRQE